ncbi:uncharacterized protein GGS22DRAFT_149956 [Annulohypoxylon maeteangense]|uniref:uncharacterized protein n=1 Tax=Annulohypoxylon maeteangense TaxID=1927788 RepID=UPI0020078CA6|nr:uncharacterized protein GGS22DRAFT_149956 [Annulohypoxylon maeteangense]KAI0890083.1 hypothetical protein GGS22DRAFT_149956 [Annulohypoxylon maeteangense]
MESKTASHSEVNRGKQSRIFQAILTPFHFVSFLLSLYLIDCYYHDKRIQEHSEQYNRLPSWVLPSWLERRLFSPQPYVWVDRKKRETSRAGTNQTRWYYHTKQRELMKMEAADAFEIQRSILVGLCFVLLLSLWLLWRLSAKFWAWTG